MRFKIQPLPVLFALLVSALVSASGLHAGATVAQGVWWVKTCKPDLMAPGYTLVHPLEGHSVYWFRDCSVEHTFDAPGRVGTVRQDGTGLIALIGSSVLAFDRFGHRDFAAYYSALPGAAHHDLLRLPSGNYLTLTKELLAGGGFDDLIVEIDTNGDVVWSWSVNEHLLGAKDGSLQLPGEPWVHSNSLDRYPDGDILLSARNLNELVRIDFPSGEVLDRWGSELLGLQHHAVVGPDETVTVFDNGVGRGESSVVKFAADGTVLLQAPLGFYSEAFGSAQELDNGNWLVVDGKAGRVLEYRPDLSTIVFELQLIRGNYIPYAPADDPVHAYLYRAERVPIMPLRELQSPDRPIRRARR